MLYFVFFSFFFFVACDWDLTGYQRLCGFPPFFGDDEDEIYDQIEAGEYEFPSPYWDPISDEAKDFIRSLLALERHDRPTVDEALQHPWIAVTFLFQI